MLSRGDYYMQTLKEHPILVDCKLGFPKSRSYETHLVQFINVHLDGAPNHGHK